MREGELSPREAVQAALDRIERDDAALNSFLTVRGRRRSPRPTRWARARAARCTACRSAVKDVIDVAGTRTTAASKILADNVADADADRRRAPAQGRRGRRRQAEHARVRVRRDDDQRRTSARRATPGTPSGSAAARAAAAAPRSPAGLVPGTLGTDTAGSIRIPAALCGVTGLRPSIGRVPNRGVVPVSWTFDTVGPLARSAEDCALLLDAIAGHDPDDPSDLPRAGPPRRRLERGSRACGSASSRTCSRGAARPTRRRSGRGRAGELAASAPASSGSTPASCARRRSSSSS